MLDAWQPVFSRSFRVSRSCGDRRPPYCARLCAESTPPGLWQSSSVLHANNERHSAAAAAEPQALFSALRGSPILPGLSERSALRRRNSVAISGKTTRLTARRHQGCCSLLTQLEWQQRCGTTHQQQSAIRYRRWYPGRPQAHARMQENNSPLH